MKKWALFVGVVLVVSILAPGVAYAANLVTNGDFEAGNTGFTSGYDYFSVRQQDGGPWIWWPAGYAVGVSPYDWHGYWPVFGDHTTGSGKMQVVNGAEDANLVLWSQTVDVQPLSVYRLSLWVAAVANIGPADLEVRVNGVAVGSKSTGTEPGTWQHGTFDWSSGSATTAKIDIVDKTTVHSGNDFCLDDVSMSALSVPVGVDIKPCSSPNAVRLSDKGVIPVAILGSTYLDAGDVDPSSLSLGDMSVRIRGDGLPQASLQDVNFDGYLDLVVQFVRTGTAFTIGQTEATVTGVTYDGTTVTGSDSIMVVR